FVFDTFNSKKICTNRSTRKKRLVQQLIHLYNNNGVNLVQDNATPDPGPLLRNLAGMQGRAGYPGSGRKQRQHQR
ncbi:hypothetical protein ACWTQY_28395, partial [Klebsiella pneumoniae]